MAATDHTEKRKQELLVQISEARGAVMGAKILLDEQVAIKKSALQESLRLPKRIKNSLSNQPVKVIGAVIASGFGFSFLMRRKSKKRNQQKEMKKSTLKDLSFSVARPVLVKIILQLSQQWLAQRAERKFSMIQKTNER